MRRIDAPQPCIRHGLPPDPALMHSTSSLSLRTASATDADLVASIHAASWQASYRGLLPEDFLDSEVVRERATYWHARMNAPGADRRLVLIAERRAEPIAFACVERQPGSPWGALLDNLHALPAHQRNGAGSLLLYAVQNWAREQGETQLCLYVLEANAAAIAFYERRGWRLSGAEPDRVGGVDITMLRYLYRLDDAAPHR